MIMLGISQLGFTQTDTVVAVDSLKQDSTIVKQDTIGKQDGIKYYQYRLSFNGIKDDSFSNDASPQLGEIFQTKPSFCEAIGQFVVVSTRDISVSEVSKPFENTEFKLTYFRKDLINR